MIERFRMLFVVLLVAGCFIALAYAVTVVLANANGSNSISELDEGNNAQRSSQMMISPPNSSSLSKGIPTSAVTPGMAQSTNPDLIVTGVTAPSYAVHGENVTVSATVKNVGNSSSPCSYTNLYLSTNRIVDSSDSLLTKENTSSLSPGSSLKVTSSVRIPSGSSGAYYILVKADGSNSISELDEGNNVGYSTPLTALVIAQRDTSNSGIALTFDDGLYIDEWYAIRPILQKYDAHVTFFVSDLARINQTQIEKLKLLQEDGNEIAFHGYYHTDVVEYLKNHSVDEYINYEIIPGIDLMKSWGLNPVDFANPYGSEDPDANQAMLDYFGHIRDTFNNNWNEIYYSYGSNRPFIEGLGIDDNYGNSDEIITATILKAKTDDKILILYGHRPVVRNPGYYETSYDRLEMILRYVSDNNMKTYTIAELN